LVAKLKSRVAKNSGSSSEDHLEVMGDERNSDIDDEEDIDAPRMSQWVDDNGDLYKDVNDEPVRPSVHHSSCKYLNIHADTSGRRWPLFNSTLFRL